MYSNLFNIFKRFHHHITYKQNTQDANLESRLLTRRQCHRSRAASGPEQSPGVRVPIESHGRDLLPRTPEPCTRAANRDHTCAPIQEDLPEIPVVARSPDDQERVAVGDGGAFPVSLREARSCIKAQGFRVNKD